MKKVLSILFSLAIILTVLPVQSFAKSDKVEIYGNKISVHAKQVCFVKGKNTKDNVVVTILAEYYEPSAPQYYYVGDETIDFKVVAEKLPELQSISVVKCDVKNTSALAEMKDLVWLGLYDNVGAENISFLKNMTGLKKFKYYNYECKSIAPISYLKNLTELFLEASVGGKEITDIKPLKGLTKLKKLDLRNCRLEELSGLSKMKNLQQFKLHGLYGYYLSDISALKGLPKLRELSLERSKNISAKEFLELTQITSVELLQCSVSDFEVFAEMKNLKSFYFTDWASPTVISTISKMTWLETLGVVSASLKDCRFLKNHKNLKKLDLFNNQITDITPLKGLTKLEYLDLGYNNIEDISALKNLKKLTYLDINSSSDIKDISPLSGLTELTGLNIADTRPESFSPLLKLKKLEFLNVYETGISDDIIAKIQKNNPKCEIRNGDLFYDE